MDLFCKFRYEIIVNTELDIDAIRRDAGLTRAAELARKQPWYDFCDICIIED